MSSRIKERDRARSVSLSLRSAEIFVLEMLARRRQLGNTVDTVSAYREAILEAGARSDIYPFIITTEGEIPSIEYEAWLRERNWHDGTTEKPTRYGGLFASIQSKRPKRKTKPRTSYR